MQNFKKAVLIIMDGFGISEKIKGNAIINAKPEFIEKLFKNYPYTTLKAHGLDVGLPENTMGNSEVGHSNIGAGRVIMQDLTKIDLLIKEDKLKTNDALSEFIEKIKKGNSTVHLIGLLSESGVHSELNHLLYLTGVFYKNGIKKIYIHPFLDGRDSPPQSSPIFLNKLMEHIKPYAGKVFISTLCGRFYAMDRDTRWDRVEVAFNLLTQAKGEKISNPLEAVKKFYDNGITDEFMPAIVIDNGAENDGRIKANDGVFFFNFRADRAKEITMSLTFDDFNYFSRGQFKPVKNFITMTKYDDSFKNKYMIEPQNYLNILGEVISNCGFNQFRIAETEKYAHVTYFFNCGREEPFKNEERLLIPSPREFKTYDLIPEMSAFKIKDALIEKIKSNKYELIVCNFANCDMVGHTGNYDAAIKAVQAVNSVISEIIPVILSLEDCICVITADHGNAETMIDDNGEPMTNHTLNPVPFVIVSNDFKKISPLKPGRLADIAPTILKLIGLEVPAEMTGRVLWE
ncbi:MAG: 2,3-bisphosphoglycerate-independent phosphoglycerate mutase [Candidatus Acidulodesulfobacterium acidiphilum]|uniref:2,3-bisphosphoglycerate-independent phosphoglycerate mutase n=1 Tax=Candidatus Acidulodesulfobacterium acidiphilum TaxID=2597224 RepID=A0A520XEC8_9DELT|nr:MAG: 2,3-bisphosphoglycerate-independent phosphoglycerate mutase [Candidatus Acidulodesulfobacterium acidiphilum]